MCPTYTVITSLERDVGYSRSVRLYKRWWFRASRFLGRTREVGFERIDPLVEAEGLIWTTGYFCPECPEFSLQ